jgi:Protein of unknown function (DUF3124)
MSRRVFFPILVAVLSLALGASCDRGRPPHPFTGHPETAARPGVVEIDPAAGPKPAVGQRVYVPAYSHIFTADDARPYNLAVTLSIRNTQDARPIVVTSVCYYDQDGRLVRHYVKRPLKLAPLASIDFFVKESDTSGGSSASFLVEWSAEQHVTEPVIEAVMIGTAGTQGISFVCPGRVLSHP